MGTSEESFRDQLVKMAQVVELMEDAFNGTTVKVNVGLNDNEFELMCRNLNNPSTNDTSIISIGTIEFTFSKK